MTVSTTQIRVSYTGDGTSTSFPIPYPFYLATDLQVLLAGAVIVSGFSVTGGVDTTGAPNPGSVVMAAAPLTGVNLQIVLNVPLTQLVKLVDGTAFPSATLNQVNDRGVQAGLRLNDMISRSIRAPDGDVSPSMMLPAALTRAGGALVFDAGGNAVIGTPVLGTVSIGTLAPILNLQQTTEEIALGITPSNFTYGGPRQASPVSDFRYGYIGNNIADDTASIQKLLTVAQAGFNALIPFNPAGSAAIKTSAGFTFQGAGGISMEGDAYLAPTGSGYTVLQIGSSRATQINPFNVAVSATGNPALDGVIFGSPTAGPIANLQRSNIDFVSVVGLAGKGVEINDCFDSSFLNVSVNQCGTPLAGTNKWAFHIGNVNTNSNMLWLGHVQVEASNGQAVKIDQGSLSISIGMLHSERTVGDGTDPTHDLGGDSLNIQNTYGGGGTNELWVLRGPNQQYTNLRLQSANVMLLGANARTYASNRIDGLQCNNVSTAGFSAINVDAWFLRSANIAGMLDYSGGPGTLKLDFCTIANVKSDGSGTDALFVDCNITGTHTVSGNASIHMRGGVSANFPAAATVFLDGVTITNAFSTLFNQAVVARNCTFLGLVTLANNGANWKSEGCVYAAGVALGSGTPGWTFGPTDRVTGGSVSAGLLAAPSSSNVAFVQGEKTWNLQPGATSVPYWVCTTAGSAGTWTAAPVL